MNSTIGLTNPTGPAWICWCFPASCTCLFCCYIYFCYVMLDIAVWGRTWAVEVPRGCVYSRRFHLWAQHNYIANIWLLIWFVTVYSNLWNSPTIRSWPLFSHAFQVRLRWSDCLRAKCLSCVKYACGLLRYIYIIYSYVLVTNDVVYHLDGNETQIYVTWFKLMYSVFFINNVVDIRGVCSAPFTFPLRLRGVTEVGIRAIGYKELGCL